MARAQRRRSNSADLAADSPTKMDGRVQDFRQAADKRVARRARKAMGRRQRRLCRRATVFARRGREETPEKTKTTEAAATVETKINVYIHSIFKYFLRSI